LHVGIDINDGGTTIGPLSEGLLLQSNQLGPIAPLRNWLSPLRDNPPAWFVAVRDRFDRDTLSQVRTTSSYVHELPLLTEYAPAFGVPGVTFATLNDARWRRDTPIDTLGRLDVDNVTAQWEALRE